MLLAVVPPRRVLTHSACGSEQLSVLTLVLVAINYRIDMTVFRDVCFPVYVAPCQWLSVVEPQLTVARVRRQTWPSVGVV